MQEEEEVRYEKISLIGQGAYGSVYKCIDMKTKSTVAMKIIKMDKSDQGISSTTLRELSILRSLSHPNIVKLIDQRLNYFGKEPQVELVFEYAEEDLSKIVKRSGCGLPTQLVKDYMKQILIGVDYMHNQRVFHRDLKPQNLLINSEGVIKIADFGLGRIVNFPLHTMSKQIETLWYRAPQLLLGCCRYDLAVDLWSVGCIFYELAQGKTLFQTDCELGQIMAIFQILGTPHLKEWEQLVGMPHFKTTFPKFEPVIKWPCKQLCGSGLNLLQRLLRPNPKERIKVKEALNHDYFMH